MLDRCNTALEDTMLALESISIFGQKAVLDIGQHGRQPVRMMATSAKHNFARKFTGAVNVRAPSPTVSTMRRRL